MKYLANYLAFFALTLSPLAHSQITITSSDPTCFGFEDGSITINVTGDESDYEFSVTDTLDVEKIVGASNTANNLTAQCYTVTVTDLTDGTVNEQTVCLNQPEQLEVELDIFNVLCNGDLTGYVEVDTVENSQGDYNNISFDWSSGLPGGIGEDSDTLLGAGTYTLDLTDDFGCAASVAFEITEPTPLELAEIGYEPAFCRLYHYQIGSGQVFAAATGGTADYTYLWENLETGATNVSTTWGGLNPGDYEMTVTDANGCILKQIVALDSVNPTPILDISSLELNGNFEGTAPVCISMTNNSEFFAKESDPLADTSFWISIDYPNDPWTLYKDSDYFETFDTCYTEGGEYEVCLRIQNKNGCEDSTCTKITVFDPLSVVPPNVFTPDGDGVNDIFTFSYLSKGVREFQCTIVDRWGTTKAEITEFEEGWDGTDESGSICKDGVYFYIYNGEAENGELFEGQGTIQIIGSSK